MIDRNMFITSSKMRALFHHLRQVLNMRSPLSVLDNEDIYVPLTVLPCQDFMNLNELMIKHEAGGSNYYAHLGNEFATP